MVRVEGWQDLVGPGGAAIAIVLCPASAAVSGLLLVCYQGSDVSGIRLNCKECLRPLDKDDIQIVL